MHEVHHNFKITNFNYTATRVRNGSAVANNHEYIKSSYLVGVQSRQLIALTFPFKKQILKLFFSANRFRRKYYSKLTNHKAIYAFLVLIILLLVIAVIVIACLCEFKYLLEIISIGKKRHRGLRTFIMNNDSLR